MRMLTYFQKATGGKPLSLQSNEISPNNGNVSYLYILECLSSVHIHSFGIL